MLCDTCSSSGWVPAAEFDDGTTRSVAPCPDCRPVQRSLYDGGHYDAGHDPDSCHVCQLHATPAKPARRRKPVEQLAMTAPRERRWWDN